MTKEQLARLIGFQAKLDNLSSSFVAAGFRDPDIARNWELLHLALDILGFPKDNTRDGNFDKPNLFCRDYLTYYYFEKVMDEATPEITLEYAVWLIEKSKKINRKIKKINQ